MKAKRTVDEYIMMFPLRARAALKEMRETLKSVAPQAKEGIVYDIPTLRAQRIIVQFEVQGDFINLYPSPIVIDAFKDELKPYNVFVGTVQFPLGKPLPVDVIKKIMRYRLASLMAV